MGLRLSETERIGRLKFRESIPLLGKGSTWGSVGIKTRFGFFDFSKALGVKRGRRRG